MGLKENVIVITGPTATGKTALAVELCRKIGGEAVSADSMQLYRGMDVGTAKATREEMRGVLHHMIDVAEPWEDFSVSRWVDMAAKCVNDIFARGKTPVIVGGTGLYIDSLLSGRDFADAPGDSGLREQLDGDYLAHGGEAFREKLRAVDPERAERLHSSDRKRLVRAMEVYLLTGKTISEHDEATKKLPPRWPSLRFVLSFADREALYRRIDARVDEMAENGLFDEAAALMKNEKITAASTSMQAIGYKQALSYLKGDMSRAQAMDEIKLLSRRYAKRQLTWFRRDREAEWILWEERIDLARGMSVISSKIDKSIPTDL